MAAVSEEQELLIVEQREEEMLPSIRSQNPVKRPAWFLKSNGGIGVPFAPYHYKAISISPSVAADQFLFKGWLGPQNKWKDWVDKLQPVYEDLWKQVGIFEAIQASCYKIGRDDPSILAATGFWSAETNTFVFPWGEATITLEDVMVLGGFSVLGEPIRPLTPVDDELERLEFDWNVERKGFGKTTAKKAADSAWIASYMEGGGDEKEHIAFLCLWLTRFVLPRHPYRTVGPNVIPVALRLARGTKLALAPAVLASLYRDLGEMKNHILRLTTSEEPASVSKTTVWAPLQLLQLWLWERFAPLRPETQTSIDADDDQPRAARWKLTRKMHDISFVKSVIESLDEFVWQPYADKLLFRQDDGEWFGGKVIENEELAPFAYCLRDSELVGLDCIEQYLPHRVSLQFGLDQDLVNYVKRVDYESDWRLAWEKYDIGDKNVLLYVPPRVCKPEFSFDYSKWWKVSMDNFLKIEKLKEEIKAMEEMTKSLDAKSGQ